jgi:hypothetical protein
MFVCQHAGGGDTIREGGIMAEIVTVTTDFGTRDGYVAAMKGVILSIAPDATIVDISHEIMPQGVAEGAFVLAQAAHWFPPGTVHLVVIDPGVGGPRRAVAVETGRHRFVAPDNGVLTQALHGEDVIAAVSLTRPRYWRAREPSATFHGRDIFAPVAAHLATGVALSAVGEAMPVDDLETLAASRPVEHPDGSIVGQIIHVDRFGNLISNIPADLLSDRPRWRVRVGGRLVEARVGSRVRVT